MKPSIYIDTSVIGGCEDERFREDSIRLMGYFERGDYLLVLSGLTLQELALAPDLVKKHLERVPQDHITTILLDAEGGDLAEAYISRGVLGSSMLADAQHIALATVARVDVLVSWNFKHIVNLHRIRGYNAVNLAWGYPLLEIRSPREVLPDD